jgi:hypothetical protein
MKRWKLTFTAAWEIHVCVIPGVVFPGDSEVFTRVDPRVYAADANPLTRIL